ncbi:helix-turn-helix transcriptional regulator [Aliiruegeria sabulilitoris]|uniref:helix-turn-helix transcriptional regulator n=1 Tax=Aliiruegeria sabulilitoris TaxID=1510458 RepID=UPI0012E3CECE|nr:AlpA family phage regulatory protein [Aliiruegeria sabulilitoris]NDR56767.1 AlpA family phage regulatory protein [Pseudoruegeria sp. M32A2M]
MHTAQATPEGLVSIATLVEMLDRSRASIYRAIERGDFPTRLQQGGVSRWLMFEVMAR